MKNRLLITFFIQLSFTCLYAQESELFTTFQFNLANPSNGDLISSRGRNACEYRESPRPDDKRLADSFACIISLHPDCHYELQVHSDCRADSVYNNELTKREAAWWGRLIEPQIPSYVNIQYAGKGESEPVNDCRCEGTYLMKHCTEEEHSLNRRVQLKVVD